jgi:hypothetical protein
VLDLDQARAGVINSGSIKGVALAAIQGLDAALKARDAEIALLKQQLVEQKRAYDRQIAALEAATAARLGALERQIAGRPVASGGRLAAAC